MIKKCISLICAVCTTIFSLLATSIPIAAENVNILPFSADAYLNDSRLRYKTSDSDTYYDINNETINIPIDATFELTAAFKNIPSSDIIQHNNQISFKLPDLFTNVSVSDSSLLNPDDRSVVGTLTVENDTVICTFTDTHLQLDSINVEFTTHATVKQNEAKENHTQTVNLGTKQYVLNFETNSDARLGTLSLEKNLSPSVIEEDDQGYLQYQLTVRTEQTPMKDVYVKDRITNNTAAVSNYVGVPNIGNQDMYTDVGTQALAIDNQETTLCPYEIVYTRIGNENVNADESGGVNNDSDPANDVDHGTVHTQAKSNNNPGTMYWKIGDMGAYETRTLTYRIKLNDNNYYGLKTSNSISNTATPYSMGYEHESATSNFTPTLNAQVNKTSGTVREDGDYLVIPYKIIITAPESNSWTLYGLKIPDNIGGNGGNVSKQDIVNIAKYENFHLYTGTEAISSNERTLPTHSNGNPQVHYESNNQYNPRFDVYAGELEPGTSKTLTYDVRINKSILTTKNGDFNLGNVSAAYCTGKQQNDSLPGHNVELGKASNIASIGSETWERKLGSNSTTADITYDISQNDKVYEIQNDHWEQINHDNFVFTVPTGSFPYNVVVNESGKWNMSSASFNDAFENNHLAYCGYVKLQHYRDGIDETSTNQDVVTALQNKSPDHIYWLKVDGLTKFSFTPSDLDSSMTTGAYLLTYYAVAQDMENISRTSVGNDFSLTGSVSGPGGTSSSMTLPGLVVKVTKVIDGDLNISAQKYGWYYDPQSIQNFQYGQLIWIIDITGNYLPAGEQFRDVPLNTTNIGQQLNNLAVLGVYRGTYGSGRDLASQAGNVQGLNKLNLTQLKQGVDWTWSRNDRVNPSTGTIALAHDFQLKNNEHIYMIVRTTPTGGSWNGNNSSPRDQKIFQNKIDVASAGSDAWQTKSTATLSAIRGGTNFKTLGSILRKSNTGQWAKYTGGSNWSTNASGDKENKIIQSYADNPGIYIDWRVKVNYAGDMNGTYDVTDTLPTGLDPLYVRYFWIDSHLYNNPPHSVRIPSLEKNPEWTEIGLKNTPMDGSARSKSMDMIAYYNASTHEIKFRIANLQNGTTKDANSFEAQVFTQITDAQALAGGKSMQYNNTMHVYAKNGTELSSSTATAQFTMPNSISKTDGTITQATVPFRIEVNPTGLMLGNGSTYITLNDVLEQPLSYMPESLKVTDITGTEITDYKTSVETVADHTNIAFQLPDKTPLIITYSARINVNHDVKFTISNKAFWDNLEDTASTVHKENQSYSAGGTSEPSGNPIFQLTKRDANNAEVLLAGAEFELKDAIFSNNHWTAVGDALYTANTDQNGKLEFNEKNLQYNHVYAVVETNAPTGYSLSSDPIFIAVARANLNVYPSETYDWPNQGVLVQYGGQTLKFDAYNKKGSLNVHKTFVNPDNRNIIPKNGEFTFALYNSQNKEVQRVVLNIVDGQKSYDRIIDDKSSKINGIEFTDLPVNDTYSIYELDRTGNIIEDSSKMFVAKNGVEYKASYSTHRVAFNTAPKQTVNIQNTQYETVVPSGIKGENMVLILLLISMPALFALLLILKNKSNQTI